MSRHKQTFTTDNPSNALSVGQTALAEAGFKPTDQPNEWKKGQGILVAPQLASLTIVDGAVQLEAWLKFALLPGVYLGEFDLEGSFMFIPKRQLRKTVAEVIAAMTNAEAVEV
ncbi:MAG: hypothetical protein AAF357_02155 [Verrucomicrobiota bacterium]